MRSRTILLIVFAAIVAGFVSLNWTELARTTTLNLGMTQAQGPLGLIMLGLLLLAAIVFLVYAVTIQTASLIESRAHSRELNAQRELANTAEASRFTELRSMIEKIETDSRLRQSDMQQWFEQRLATLQHDVNSKVEASGNTLAAFMGELDDRVQQHMGLPGEEAAARPRLSPAATAGEPVMAASEPAPPATAAPAARAGGVASLTSMAKRLFAGDKPGAVTATVGDMPPAGTGTRQDPSMPPPPPAA